MFVLSLCQLFSFLRFVFFVGADLSLCSVQPLSSVSVVVSFFLFSFFFISRLALVCNLFVLFSIACACKKRMVIWMQLNYFPNCTWPEAKAV